MTLSSDHILRRLLVREEQHLIRDFRIPCIMLGSSTETRVNEALGGILWAFSVDVSITKVLSAEGAHKFVLFELPSVSINESCPLVHLVTRFLVKLVLIVIVFLFEFL